jgi:ABC-type phosphate transport system substrate-binding protein
MRRSAAFGWLLAAVLPLLSLSIVAAAQSQESFLVIVNSANPVTSLSRSHLSALFLREVRSWEHGEQVLPADQSSASALRERFSDEIHGRSASAIKAYWQQEVFAGREVGPPELGSDSEVVAYVQRHPGAIGYVSASTSTKDVKVVEIQE